MPTENEAAIWYIEASDPVSGLQSMGSAIALRLRSAQGKQARVLLTCGHVVRADASEGDDREGSGEVFAALTVYAPGSGYAPAAAVAATLWEPIGQSAGELASGLRHAANDWVLLQLQNEAVIARTADPAPAAATAPGTAVQVIGYPGGGGRFDKASRSIVKPTPVSNLVLADADRGQLSIDGRETRKGMSGGGVFTAQGGLLGVHRWADDNQKLTLAVDLRSVAEELQRHGWSIVPDPAPAEEVAFPVVQKLWALAALIYVLVTFNFVARSQWSFGLSLPGLTSSPGSDGWYHEVAGLFGTAFCGVLLVLVCALTDYWLRRMRQLDPDARGWKLVPPFGERVLPSRDPIGKGVRVLVIAFVFVLAPVGLIHLYKTFLQGSVYMQCVVPETAPTSVTAADCLQYDGARPPGAVKRFLPLGSGVATHLAMPPPIWHEYFKQRYSFGGEPGKSDKQYYPLAQGWVFLLLTAYALFRCARTLWHMFRAAAPGA